MKETDSEQSQVDGQPKKDDTAPKTSSTAYELPWYCLWLFVSALSWHLNELHVAKDSEPAAFFFFFTTTELPSSSFFAVSCSL